MQYKVIKRDDFLAEMKEMKSVLRGCSFVISQMVGVPRHQYRNMLQGQIKDEVKLGRALLCAKIIYKLRTVDAIIGKDQLLHLGTKKLQEILAPAA